MRGLGLVLMLGCAAAWAEGPLYTNAELLSFDLRTRLVTVRTNRGELRTMRLAEGVAGPRGARAGDPVILALRGNAAEPEIPLITRILPSVAAAGREQATVDPAAAPALSAFERAVKGLARKAADVDALWEEFAADCRASVEEPYDRDWFGLWDERVRADLTSARCRGLRDEIVLRGEKVKTALHWARAHARRAALPPALVQHLLREHSLLWEASLAQPERPRS